MKHFERDYLFEKWTKTRLLKDLSPDKSYEIAKMLELQACYLVKHMESDKQPINERIEFLRWSSFQVIARLFADEELQFTFDTTAYPAFLVYRPDKYEGKETFASTVRHYKFQPFECVNQRDQIREASYHPLHAQVEMCERLTEEIKTQLNKEHAGKHLIFFTPLQVDPSDGTFSWRGVSLPDGSSKFEENEE